MIESTSPVIDPNSLLLLLGIAAFLVIAVRGSSGGSNSPNLLVRIIWFVTIGWWLGTIWFSLSLLLMFTIIFFPIGAWAATKTWKVMTLSGSSGPRDAAQDISVEVENQVRQETTTDSSSERRRDHSSEDREIDEEDDLDKIEKLNELKEKGAITEEEFKDKKEDLMDNI